MGLTMHTGSNDLFDLDCISSDLGLGNKYTKYETVSSRTALSVSYQISVESRLLSSFFSYKLGGS